MKKKLYTNPAIYPVFIVGLVAMIILFNELIAKTYISLAQEIATYVMTVAFIFSICWLGKSVYRPIPLTYDKKEITIIRYFRKNIVLSYQDIIKVEFYNRYDKLIIITKDEKYKFQFLLKTKDLKSILKKRVRDVNF